MQRLFFLALLSPPLAACTKHGISLDDTALSEGDTDSDSDTDTDTDTDADVPGDWVGTVGIEFVEPGVPFCEGASELSIAVGGELLGSGDCIVMGGPAQGQTVALAYSGQVDGSGAIAGEVEATWDSPQPQPLPSAALEGQVGGTELIMEFAMDIPDAENPGQTVAAAGTVQASSVE